VSGVVDAIAAPAIRDLDGASPALLPVLEQEEGEEEGEEGDGHGVGNPADEGGDVVREPGLHAGAHRADLNRQLR
jgi:hypothetical protein